MNLIEFLGNNWLIIIIFGLAGLKIMLLINQRYIDKKIDLMNTTEKEKNMMLAIVGLVITIMFASVGYYFWNTYNNVYQMPLFIGLTTMGFFIMFSGKYFDWLQKRDDKNWKNKYGGNTHGTLPKGFEKEGPKQ